MSVALTQPEVLGEIPAHQINAVSRTHDGLYQWRTLDMLPKKQLRAVEPLVQSVATLADLAVSRHVYVFVDHARVKPGRAHRGDATGWHCDSKDVFLLTSAFPTEFAVGALHPGARSWWDELEKPNKDAYKELADSFGNNALNEDIGLEPWYPKPNQVVRQDYTHIHRSPTWEGQTSLDRLFMAVLFP